MKRFSFALIASAAILAAGGSYAADLPVSNNYNHVEYKRYGNTYNWTPLNGATPSAGSVSFPPRTTISTVEPKITTQVKLPFDKRGSVPFGQMANITTPITKVAFARALVAGAKVATPLGAAVSALELLKFFKDQGLMNVRNTPDGLIAEGSSGGGEYEMSDGKEYAVYSLPWQRTAQAACSAYYAYAYPSLSMTASVEEGLCVGRYTRSDGSQFVDRQTFSIRSSSSCPAGWFIKGDKCTQNPESAEINEPQIMDKIASSPGWDDSAAAALKRAMDSGINPEVGNPIVSGPSSIPGDKTTSRENIQLNPNTNTPAAPGASNTQPGTKTTTKETKTDINYSGGSATTTTTTTTTTNITNNITNITTTETSTETKEEDEKQEDPPTDTPFGDIPELYKQKYPEGISGVINQKMEALRATPLFRLPSMLMPDLPNSGSCPSWQIDLGLASWADMGTHTIQAPCMVWDFGKVIILISALLLARRLIFGG